jgi:EmrB/QacA subfamily drug resistance transporter
VDTGPDRAPSTVAAGRPDRYKWTALSNTTLGSFMATLDGSIVIVSMPAIFRGIGLDPLAPGNIVYLLWMVLGYLLTSAVLVVVLGRLGDMYGRVRMFNLGFLIFSLASLALSLDPYQGHAGAAWLILLRLVQAVGGSMLTANSAAIITDAFPVHQRGMALGINQISALTGQFLGLLAGGLLAVIDWRAVFWINVPIGVVGTIWSYRSLRANDVRERVRIDWFGTIAFTLGTAVLLVAITHGVQPYGTHPTGWLNPLVLSGILGGLIVLAVFVAFERRIADPMFDLSLFRIRTFAAGNIAALLVAIARGGLQFMLVIWLQGVWLPLHGYDFADTPLWAGIYMLPLTIGFLVAGPLTGYLSDRLSPRPFATGGLLVIAATFVGLLLLPVNFSYPAFALLLLFNGIGQGMFSAPNTAAVMSSVPAPQRGSASGMRSAFQTSGNALSIGVFFSLMTAGLASTLPASLYDGLTVHGVAPETARQVAALPPVSSLFATFLGVNPVDHLLASSHALDSLPGADVAVLTGNTFFPQLISGPFQRGLAVVFAAAALMSVAAAAASFLRGRGAGHVPRPRQTAVQPPSTASTEPVT